MTNITISVVMATYNGQQYLRDQLDSIDQQILRPDELIIGDDGSTDETLNVIDEFRKRCGFEVNVVHNDRSGVGSNFLSAFEVSQGRYVAFADQDDVWSPAKLKVLTATLREGQADIVAHGVRTVDDTLRPIRSGYPNVRRVTLEDRLHGNIWFPIGGNTMLFNRTLLEGCDWSKRPPSQWSHDQMNHDDLVKIMGAIRGRTIRIPDRLLLYRQHRANVEGASRTLVQAARGYSDPIEGVAHRIEVVANWAEYFTPLVPIDRQDITRRYFESGARMMKNRYDRLQQKTPRALTAIIASVSRGEYSRRRPDGLDWKWALQDLYSLLKR